MSESQNKDTEKIPEKLFNCSKFKFGIIVSEWHSDITFKMAELAKDILQIAKCPKNNIYTIKVPGSFELPLAAKMLAKKKNINGIICIGCIVKGETPHFDFISSSVSDAIMQLNLELNIPVVFGVLTVENTQQAEQRINKGAEAAKTLIKMTKIKLKLKTWI
jgi:6,7-dimethyl-8-ribityllumazine synthase